MPNKTKTIEELLIELDAADTQLSNESARVIRQLKQKIDFAHDYTLRALEQLNIGNN